MPLSPLLRRYDAVLLDLDGCVWVGAEATDRAAEAVAALRGAGKKLAFVTNDAQRSGEEYVRKLWGLGLQASAEEVVTVGGAIQHFLAERADRLRTAFVVGSEATRRHVTDAGLSVMNGTDLATRVDVVVVAGHDFDYADLRTATQAVLRGALLLGGGRDRTFPMEDGPWPATGAVVAALEYATGATAETLGKPDPQIFLTAVDRLGASRALVVGDRVDADLAGAEAAGLDAALVLTGATSREDLAALDDPPRLVADSLGALVLGD